MRDDIQFIRDCAARGLSKSHTAQLMGFWPASFKWILESLGLRDLEWCKPSESVLAKQQRRDLHASRRGLKLQLTDDERQVLTARALHASLSRKLPMLTAFGVTDTIGNLVRRFGVVSIPTVKRRMAKMGMTLEEALTTPRVDHEVALGKKTAHIWQKYSKGNYLVNADRSAGKASA